MPLLDFVGVDASQRSFCVAFAFLSGEKEEDFAWAFGVKSLYGNVRPSVILTDRCLAAINAAYSVFPSIPVLICLWHANKAVQAHCRPAFRRKK